MILIIDNFDSFTYNVSQLFQQLGVEVKVIRNNVIDCGGVRKLNPEAIVFSPGPGRPEKAGNMMAILHEFKGKLPILGICLGHQAIGLEFGMILDNAVQIMHGKISEINHDGRGLFEHLPQKIKVVRYHSLALKRETLPQELEITAETDDGEIMGIRHKEYLLEGIQYHPESILSTTGKRQLANFLKMAQIQVAKC